MWWKSEMIAPPNSGPRPVLMVVGEKAFQTIDSHIGSDEERNTRPKTVTFSKKLVK
jgi:hypothetical protein